MKSYEILCENFRYVGAGADKHTTPHLQSMMDNAKQISFGTFSKAVGIDQVRELFRDYQWGRGSNVRMRNDPYISYFKSKYDGKLCYYVRQAGIEYIFVENGDEAEGTPRPVSKSYSIMPDGQMIDGKNDLAVFHGEKAPSHLVINQNREPTKAAAQTMYRTIKQSKLETIKSDGQEAPAKQVLKYLEKLF